MLKNAGAISYLHCAKKHGQGIKKQDERSRESGSVKLQFLDWQKMPKNELSENVQCFWSSKTSHNGSNKALFETISKLKSKIHKKAVDKVFIVMDCTKI